MTTTSSISRLSLDDIVFEGRNKAYGAYALRRIYGRHVLKALGVAGALLLVLISFPVFIQTYWPAVVEVPLIVPVGPIAVILPPPTLVVPPPVTPQPPAARTTGSVRINPDNLPPEIVDDTKAKDLNLPPVPAPKFDGPVAKGDVNIDRDDVSLAGASSGPKRGDSVGSTNLPTATKPFEYVEVMPEFAGGTAAMIKYLQCNLKYPSQALRAGVEGRVYIAFTVNSDGTISDVDVLKGLGYGADEEASRVISQMPAWKPGYQNQRAVPVRYTLPITFHYQ